MGPVQKPLALFQLLQELGPWSGAHLINHLGRLLPGALESLLLNESPGHAQILVYARAPSFAGPSREAGIRSTWWPRGDQNSRFRSNLLQRQSLVPEISLVEVAAWARRLYLCGWDNQL